MATDTAAVLAAIEAARPPDDPDVILQPAALDALCDVAAAAAELMEYRYLTRRAEPWYMSADLCIGCGATPHWNGIIPHTPDCPAMALDRALAALAAVDNPSTG